MVMNKEWFEEKVKNEEGSQTNAGVSASSSNELLCEKVEYIAVPITELKKLEEARQALYDDIYDDLTPFKQMELSNLTQQIWRVANTKKWD